ncbi:response regulator transcription factor [Dactylosporangium sp. NPDC049742]|uniref:response regulator transcription factor n=1 Tax=Dactylosporangium sp. NPDC049742 TaxID=3154737 RepID=UPI0034158C99
MIRVAVAAEHAESRALFAALPGIEVVASVATGREAAEAVATTRPDVLVMDLRLSGLDAVVSRAAVLVLSMSEGAEQVFAAMRAGARGYLVRGATQDEIRHGIATVAAGRAFFGPGVARRMLDHFATAESSDQLAAAESNDHFAAAGLSDQFAAAADLSDHVAAAGSSDGVAAARLSAKERQVLELVAAGLPAATVATRLGLAAGTVAGYMSAIVTKLHGSSGRPPGPRAGRGGSAASPAAPG